MEQTKLCLSFTIPIGSYWFGHPFLAFIFPLGFALVCASQVSTLGRGTIHTRVRVCDLPGGLSFVWVCAAQG